MRKLLLALVVVCPLFGQAVRVDPLPALTTASTVGGGNPSGAMVPVLSQGPVIVTLCGYQPTPTQGVACTNYATAYTDATATTPCPTNAPVVLGGHNTCQPTSDQQGNFGFWVAPGNYEYTVSVMSNGKTYGPYPITAGGSGGGGGGGTQNSAGPLASIPATCSPANADIYFATDQPIQHQLYACTATNKWTLQSQFTKQLSAKEYGAVGDGVTDDTAAMTSFITAINACNGLCSAYIPAGKYLINGTLRPNVSTWYHGDGTDSTFLIETNATADLWIQQDTVQQVGVGWSPGPVVTDMSFAGQGVATTGNLTVIATNGRSIWQRVAWFGHAGRAVLVESERTYMSDFHMSHIRQPLVFLDTQSVNESYFHDFTIMQPGWVYNDLATGTSTANFCYSGNAVAGVLPTSGTFIQDQHYAIEIGSNSSNLHFVNGSIKPTICEGAIHAVRAHEMSIEHVYIEGFTANSVEPAISYGGAHNRTTLPSAIGNSATTFDIADGSWFPGYTHLASDVLTAAGPLQYVIYPPDYIYGSTAASTLGGGILKGTYEYVTKIGIVHDTTSSGWHMVVQGRGTNGTTAHAWATGAIVSEGWGSAPIGPTELLYAGPITISNDHINSIETYTPNITLNCNADAGHTCGEFILGETTDLFFNAQGTSTNRFSGSPALLLRDENEIFCAAGTAQGIIDVYNTAYLNVDNTFQTWVNAGGNFPATTGNLTVGGGICGVTREIGTLTGTSAFTYKDSVSSWTSFGPSNAQLVGYGFSDGITGPYTHPTVAVPTCPTCYQQYSILSPNPGSATPNWELAFNSAANGGLEYLVGGTLLDDFAPSGGFITNGGDMTVGTPGFAFNINNITGAKLGGPGPGQSRWYPRGDDFVQQWCSVGNQDSERCTQPVHFTNSPSISGSTMTIDFGHFADQNILLFSNITSSTVAGFLPNVPYNLEICQNGTGGWNWTAPGNVSGATYPTAANACIYQTWVSFDGTTMVALGGTGSGAPTSSGPSFIPSGTTGATYCVSASLGSDSNSGSCTSPWKTLAKINSSVFNPGDQVLLLDTDVFYGELNFPSSGTSGAPITISMYGPNPCPTGTNTPQARPGSGCNRPIIDAADVVSNWTQNGTFSDVWQSPFTFTAAKAFVDSRYVETSPLTFQTSIANVHTNGGTFSDGTNVYVKLADNSNPNGHTMEVSSNHYPYGVEMLSRSYLVVDGLEVIRAQNSSIHGDQTTVVVGGITFAHFNNNITVQNTVVFNYGDSIVANFPEAGISASSSQVGVVDQLTGWNMVNNWIGRGDYNGALNYGSAGIALMGATLSNISGNHVATVNSFGIRVSDWYANVPCSLINITSGDVTNSLGNISIAGCAYSKVSGVNIHDSGGYGVGVGNGVNATGSIGWQVLHSTIARLKSAYSAGMYNGIDCNSGGSSSGPSGGFAVGNDISEVAAAGLTLETACTTATLFGNRIDATKNTDVNNLNPGTGLVIYMVSGSATGFASTNDTLVSGAGNVGSAITYNGSPISVATFFANGYGTTLGAGGGGGGGGTDPNAVHFNVSSLQTMAGNLNAPCFNDVCSPDWVTTAGAWMGAWSSSTTYTFGQTVSFSGSNYIEVNLSGNTNVTPGTAGTTWQVIPSWATNPVATALDQAFYYAIANGNSYVMRLGSRPFSAPYQTCIGLLENSGSNLIAFAGENAADNRIPGSEIQQSCNIGTNWTITKPSFGGSAPYNFGISKINIDANSFAAGCISAMSFKESVWEHIHCRNWTNNATSTPFVIGNPLGETASYENYFDDLKAQGNANGLVGVGAVTVAISGGVPVFTVTSGGSYVYQPSRVVLNGLSCSTFPSFTTTFSGTGPYTLTGVTQSGGVGCSAGAGGVYGYVPDIGLPQYGFKISNISDSTWKDIVSQTAGAVYGIFWNGASSNTIIHEHIYNGQPTQISDSGYNTHWDTEFDTPFSIGASGGNMNHTTYVHSKVVPNGPGGGSYPGLTLFAVFSTTGTLEIDGSTCLNTATSANPFALLFYNNAQIAHGAYFGANVAVKNAQNCDTLTYENSQPNKALFGTGINLAGTASPLYLNGSAGTSGQVPISGGPGVTPSWGAGGGGGGGSVAANGEGVCFVTISGVSTGKICNGITPVTTTSTFSVPYSAVGQTIAYSGSGAGNFGLAQPGIGAQWVAGDVVEITNYSASSIGFTVSGGATITVSGGGAVAAASSTYTLATGYSMTVKSDGTNYWAVRH